MKHGVVVGRSRSEVKLPIEKILEAEHGAQTAVDIFYNIDK